MTPVSATVAERSRKFHSLVLQRVSSVGQIHIAEQLGVSEATVSRAINEQLERACQVLASVGLKVVPVEMKCYEPRKIAILLELARDHLAQLDNVEQLSFD
jgi:hypothetical protein